MSQPVISMIVAMAENRVIGLNNAMPWHLPEDLRYFKQVTLNKPVIMGRNTLESIGKPLSQRENIIVSRNPAYSVAGAKVLNSPITALDYAVCMLATRADTGQQEDTSTMTEIMVIGGAQLYAELFPQAQRLYLTEVKATIHGDAYFPEFAREEWREIAREEHKACERNPYDYAFVVLERKNSNNDSFSYQESD
jgi:dihydrofolate reductase